MWLCTTHSAVKSLARGKGTTYDSAVLRCFVTKILIKVSSPLPPTPLTRLIEQLQYIGRAIGCYKVILNCTAENVAFYEKCNLKKKDVQMTHYFEPFMIKIEEEINQQNYVKYQQRQATLDIGLSPNAEKSFRTMLLEAEQRLQSSSIRQQPTVSTKLTADPEEMKGDA